MNSIVSKVGFYPIFKCPPWAFLRTWRISDRKEWTEACPGVHRKVVEQAPQAVIRGQKWSGEDAIVLVSRNFMIDRDALEEAVVGLSAKLADRIRQAATRLSLAKIPETTSGALHDAAILAPIIPTIMLFVASRDGISHNPGEFSRTEDMAMATRLLYEAVSKA